MEQPKHNVELSDYELAFTASDVEFTLFLIKCWAHDKPQEAVNVIGTIVPALAHGYAENFKDLVAYKDRLFIQATKIDAATLMGISKKDGNAVVIPRKDQMN